MGHKKRGESEEKRDENSMKSAKKNGSKGKCRMKAIGGKKGRKSRKVVKEGRKEVKEGRKEGSQGRKQERNEGRKSRKETRKKVKEVRKEGSQER